MSTGKANHPGRSQTKHLHCQNSYYVWNVYSFERLKLGSLKPKDFATFGERILQRRIALLASNIPLLIKKCQLPLNFCINPDTTEEAMNAVVY